MPLVRENSQLYEVIKVGTVSGVPLLTSGTVNISGVTTSSGLLPVDVLGSTNTNTALRDAFETYTPGTTWNQTLGTGDLIFLDGNTAASSYLVISKDPLTAGNDSRIESVAFFPFPAEISVGLSLSQRTLGQDISLEIIDNGTVLPAVADIAISSITQTTTTLTVDTVSAHNLNVGRTIGIRDCSNQLANYPSLVVASVPSPTQFTATAGPGGTIPSQTITNPAGAKGFVFIRERLGRAQNGSSIIFETTSATTASLYIRAEAGDIYSTGTIAGNHSITVGSTAPVALVTSAYQYAFSPTTEYKFLGQADKVQWADSAVDSIGALSNRLARNSIVPDFSELYRLRFRGVNSKSLTVPNAQVISITKSGSTTGTFTTDVAHNLTTGDGIVYYGSSDNTAANFPNLGTATTVTVLSPTTFTAIIGTGTTGTAYGGYVAKVQGGNLMSALGGIAQTAINATLSTLSDGTRQLVLTGSAAWSGLSIGDICNVVGCRNSTNGGTLSVDGPWKVANVVTTALTLVLPYASQRVLPSDFALTNCGGAVIKRTDLRISFARVFDYDRQRVEMLARPGGDQYSSFPTYVNNQVTVGIAASQTLATVTAANLNFPQTIADVASAALTTTTTTATLTPTFGCSYSVSIPVTAVTGTNPTLDVSIEESDDTGTNWFKVYDFPRITAAGIYRSPLIPLIGNRVRYVQTVAGTSPSFTRAINRLQSSQPAFAVRQLIDRTIVLTTLNSTTPSLDCRDAGNRVQLVVNVGAITATAPILQMEGSDDNGTTWYNVGGTLTAVASSTVQLTVVDVNSALIRARVSTAGVGVTAGYVMVKAHD